MREVRLTEALIDEAIRLQEVMINKKNGEEPSLFELFMYQVLKELKAYQETGLSPEVVKNYKLFEDECIRDELTFKDILIMKSVVKGMTCKECKHRGTCAIYDNFNIRYCSDWEKDLELIIPTEQLKEMLENQFKKG